jgi:hypothetical protein
MEVNRYDGEGRPVLDDLVIEGGLSAGQIDGFLCVGSETELTISGGEITVTQSYHDVDTQGGAASDDLDTINGGNIGSFLVLRPENAARTVVLKDATGNLVLAGDFTMDHRSDMILLIFGGTNWVELSRSDNA